MTTLLAPKSGLVTRPAPIVIAPAPAKLITLPGTADSPRRWIETAQWEAKQRAEAARLGVPLIGGGAAGAWTLTNNGRTHILDGTWAIGTDSFKAALFLSTSNIGASSDLYSGLTNEVASANGYTTGGIAVTLSLSGTSTVTVAFTQAQWTASGGNITARFVVIYEVSGKVLAYALCDSTPADVTAVDGNTFTLAAGNVLSLA